MRSAAARVDLEPSAPFDGDALRAWLAARAIPGVEEVAGTTYRRVARAPDPVVVAVGLGPDRAVATLPTGLDRRARAALVASLRVLVGADVDPREAVAALTAADPLLAPAIGARPAVRPAGTIDPGELAVRAILGQQISVGRARALAADLAARLGEPVGDAGGLARAFPNAAAIAASDPAAIRGPRRRAEAITGLAAALASGELVLDPADPEASRAALLARPGVGPWTAEYVALRALRDPDAFPASDLGILRGARVLGLPDSPRALLAHAERWRPWRAFAAEHLWAVDASRSGSAAVAGAPAEMLEDAS